MKNNRLYRIETYSRVKRDLKQLDKKLQEYILKECYPKIEEDPYQAYSLSYQFKGLWSYHISYRGSEYRIVYEIYPQDDLVLVIMIGSREGFYKALRRRVKG